MYNPFTLQGKTILVTGASSGIGRAAAIECSRMGARVIVTGRNEERLKETLGQLEGEGPTCPTTPNWTIWWNRLRCWTGWSTMRELTICSRSFLLIEKNCPVCWRLTPSPPFY